MEITTKAFQEEVLNFEIPVLLECWASWCLPCKQIEPALERLSNTFKGKCKVLKINIDKNPLISSRYGVKGLPTFMTFVRGNEFERKVGSQSDEVLSGMIENAINEFDVVNQNSTCELTDEEEQKIIEERLKDLGYL